MINDNDNSYIDDWVFFYSSQDGLWHATLREDLRKITKSKNHTLTTYTATSLQILVGYVDENILKKTNSTDLN